MHIPVLQKEIIEYLKPQPDENFIDCTIGEGGHAKLILEKNQPNGKILGIDLDERQIEHSRNVFPKERVLLEQGNFSEIKKIAEKNNFFPVNGIIADLGMSSYHIDSSERGFSFLKNEPLDMRYDKNQSVSARDIVNNYYEEDLERILREFGQERFSRKISEKIAEKRKIQPIETAFQLIEAVKEAIPLKFQNQKIHFATRTFQAIRIEANKELENLTNFIPQAIDILEPKGRLIIISFHSLEDKMVKNLFKEYFKEGRVNILTKKPIKPNSSEIEENRRSRSANLRAVEKI